MKYKVLIVDDEPIILSGIKSLIDWAQQDCIVLGTARNGKDALAAIQKERPEIVLCDINMPVMNGIELLQQVAELDPTIVVIMLTNLEDFSLAQTAMRYHAVDYILKSQLEPAALEKALHRAQQESNDRITLRSANFAEETQAYAQTQTLKKAMTQFLQETSQNRTAQTIKLLQSHQANCNIGAMYLSFDFSALPQFSTFQQEDKKRIFDWQIETIEQVAQNNWQDFIVLPMPENDCNAFLFTWNNDMAQWAEKTEHFFKKLASVSLKITQVPVALLATDCFESAQALSQCRTQLHTLADYHYNTSAPYILFSALPALSFRPMPLQNVTDYFAEKMQAKDFRGCHLLLNKLQEKLTEAYYSRQTCTWICHELSDITYQTLRALGKQENTDLFQSVIDSQNAAHLTTKKKVLFWLAHLQRELDTLSTQMNTGKTDTLEKACGYIQDNITQHISLQDVAEHVALSPNYLSSVFKKQYGKSLVEYINEAKIGHAKHLIKEENMRIYEISNALGFENAYYFAKVFKRHTGMSPSDYQYSCKHTLSE